MSDFAVMILAAGRGERMRPLTDHTPKPLLKVGGKSLIAWHLERFARWGVQRVVINHAHLGAQIEAELGRGERYGLNLVYSAETVALETAGGIAQALPLLGTSPVFVVNGDVFCDLQQTEVEQALVKMRTGGIQAHLWLVENPQHRPGGDFTLLENGRVMAETGLSQGTALTFSGVGLYQPSLFSSVASGEKAALAPILRCAMQQQQVTGQQLTGRWVDVGTPERLYELDEQINGQSS